MPQGRIRHIAESSLSLLSEKHLQRLRQNGFQAILPGIESWYDLGNKSKTRRTGMDKVLQVSEHVNMILRYIPYVQTNFVMGLDGDMGPEPFELTKKFIDLSPWRIPGVLAALGLWPGGADEPGLPAGGPGASVPLPLPEQQPRHERPAQELHLAGVLQAPGGCHPVLVLLESHRPAHSGDANDDSEMDERGAGDIVGRVGADPTITRRFSGLLETDRSVRRYMEGETDVLPEFYASRIRRELGPAYDFLPEGALYARPQRLSARHHRAGPGQDRAARRTNGSLTVTDRQRASGFHSGRPPGPPLETRSARPPCSRSPCGVTALARCQSRSFCPTVVAGSQTPGSTAGYRSAILRPKPCLPNVLLHRTSR